MEGSTPGKMRLSDVAARAGVSRATASRALRSDPRISRPTTERVKEAALALDYVPDPVISRWAANAWKKRRSATSGYEIAFISLLSEPEQTACYPSARQRAQEMGYSLNFYSLTKLGSWNRLNQIIRAKSIPGVLLDKWNSDDPVLLDADHISVVCCGVGRELPYHTVRLDTFRQMEIMWKQIRQLGRQRIFLWLQEASRSLHGRLHYGAALECERFFKPQVQLAHTDFGSILTDQLVQKVLARRADAIVSLVNNHAVELEARLRGKGWEGDLLLLRTIPGTGYSGILPHDDLVGQQSVTLLDRLIRDFETGIPANQFQLMISPDWHEEPA